MSEWQPPRIEVLREEDLSPEHAPGFLRLRRWRLRNRYADGRTSEAYLYDMVERRATDAVVLALHDGGGRVCLRSSLRPPVTFRTELPVPVDAEVSPVMWELPAGLVEPDERGEAGLRACAARETLEETGFRIAADAFVPLGAPVFLSPGVIAERLYYFAAEVDPAERGTPTEDGTPVEEGAAVRFVSLEEAIAAADAGHVGDAKSELGLRRLAGMIG